MDGEFIKPIINITHSHKVLNCPPVCECLRRRRPVTQVEVASFPVLFLAHLQVSVLSSVQRKACCLGWRAGISKGTTSKVCKFIDLAVNTAHSSPELP